MSTLCGTDLDLSITMKMGRKKQQHSSSVTKSIMFKMVCYYTLLCCVLCLFVVGVSLVFLIYFSLFLLL